MYLCKQRLSPSDAQRHPVLTSAGTETRRVRVVTQTILIQNYHANTHNSDDLYLLTDCSFTVIFMVKYTSSVHESGVFKSCLTMLKTHFNLNYGCLTN